MRDRLPAQVQSTYPRNETLSRKTAEAGASGPMTIRIGTNAADRARAPAVPQPCRNDG